MSTEPRTKTVVVDGITIDLKIPAVAAFWAWLIPGAGHFYQRRYRKAALFSLCIFSTYFLGMIVGGGKVVYAKWDNEEKRWPFCCQLGAGAVALPAVLQSYRQSNRQTLLWNGFMAPPNRFTLSEWNKEYAAAFELGTLYTMIAGLMNILVIFDAFFGPMPLPVPTAKNKTNKGEPDAPPEPAGK
jgi:hypothetical protein